MFFIDTKELGAGTYPSPKELSGYKCYVFKVNVSIVGEGYVYAKDEEEAKKLIYLGSWEELAKFKIERVEEITDLKETDD